MMDGVPTASMAAFETQTERYCTADNPGFGWLTPGQYMASFVVPHGGYHAAVEFEVQEVLGESAVARVAVREMERAPGPPFPGPEGCLGITAAALRTAKTTVLMSKPRVVCGDQRRGKSLLWSLNGFTRIAEVPEGVTKLSLEPLLDGTTAVMWTSGTGVEKEFRLAPPAVRGRP